MKLKLYFRRSKIKKSFVGVSFLLEEFMNLIMCSSMAYNLSTSFELHFFYLKRKSTIIN